MIVKKTNLKTTKSEKIVKNWTNLVQYVEALYKIDTIDL